MYSSYNLTLSDTPKMAKIHLEGVLWAEIKNDLEHATVVLHPRKDGKPWEMSYYFAIGALEDAKRQLYYNHRPPTQTS